MAIQYRKLPAGLALASCLALAAFGNPAHAQTARSGSSTANAQLTQQLQQLGTERTTLLADNERMKKQVADLTKERDALKASRAALEQRAGHASEALLARSEQQRQAAESETEKQKQRMQEIVTKFREMAQTLKDVETERTTFKQSLTQRDAELTQCVGKNQALYKINEEMLARMDGEGVFARVGRAEPFTKLMRVRLENVMENYKNQAEDQKVTTLPPAAASAPTSDTRTR